MNNRNHLDHYREGLFKPEINNNKNSADLKKNTPDTLFESIETRKQTKFNYQIYQKKVNLLQQKREEYFQYKNQAETEVDLLDLLRKEAELDKETIHNQKPLNFNTVSQDNNFFIFSDDINYLEHTMDTLIAYTKNVSFHSPIYEKAINKTINKTIENQAAFNLGNHYICANDFFPLWLNEYLKILDKTPWSTSCFCFARFTSGLVPIVYEDYAVGGPELERVKSGDLLPGDYIYLEKGKHAFTYLNKDICLSANGRNQPLQLLPLRNVLSSYKDPDKNPDACLTLSEREIVINRKKEDFNYPDNVRKLFINIINQNQSHYSNSIIRKNLGPVAVAFCQFLLTDKSVCTEILLNNFYQFSGSLDCCVTDCMNEMKNALDTTPRHHSSSMK